MIGVFYDMRNIFNIFKSDIKALGRHFFALLIILAICILPALYAWFNIYAFWDPYENTRNMKVAVVCNDRDYLDEDGKVINIGNELVTELKADSDNMGYVFLDDADKAIKGTYNGDYYAAIVIEPDFTYNMYNFLSADIKDPTICFYQNEKKNAVAVKITDAVADKVKKVVNEKYSAAIVETLFEKLNTLSMDIEGDSPLTLVRNTLSTVNSNLLNYDASINGFIDANNALINTLNDTNGTIGYSIYLIGNERVNISDQIYYVGDIKNDLSLINDEVGNMMTGLEDAVEEAIYKLDRLYEGEIDDPEAAAQALAELERQYQELIDYITHSGLSGPEIDDALSALNTLADKISQLRKEIGLDDNAKNQSASETRELIEENRNSIKALQTDFEKSAVPKVYTAMTGYAYDDLSKPEATQQSLETALDYTMMDIDKRIDRIKSNLNYAQTAASEEGRIAALEAAKKDTAIVQQEVDAVAAVTDSFGEATGNKNAAKAASAAKSSSSDINGIGDIYDKIFAGEHDIDLKRDLQLVYDALDVTRETLTEVVYPTLDTMLGDLQDTMGDMSGLLLDLSNVLGKTQPILGAVGETFGAVNNTLIQVKDLINNYSSRIGEILGILDGDSDDSRIQDILDFFSMDPETIGEFIASPVGIETEYIYPVKSYGTAMTPFYTMLAVWVGCIIINSIIKIEGPIAVENATHVESFFGRYLIYFLISLIQTMIIMIGDLLLMGISCVNPGLFLLTGLITSLTVSMLGYGLAVTFGNIGKALFVVIMIIQIAGSGGSYPIELLPGFFQDVYMLFPFPYAINAMRETIAGLYQHDYLIYILQLLIFFAIGLVLGLLAKKPLSGINKYMNEQLENTEMM